MKNTFSFSISSLRGRIKFALTRRVIKLYEEDRLTDKQFLNIRYFLGHGRFINWKNPKTFCEKLQWLKLYNRKPEYTVMVDKVKFKEWAAGIIGEEYIIPTLAVWDRPEDIDFSVLPSRFVLKCNHSSGNNYIHSDDSQPDTQHIVNILKATYKQNYFKHGGEWPYKDVEKKILAETYISDLSKNELPDYKFYCFNGIPRYIRVSVTAFHDFFSDNRTVKGHQGFYDMEWKKQEFIQVNLSRSNIDIEKPANFEKMAELAAKLSQGIPFVRVDFYNIDGKIYVGEMTFFPGNGFHRHSPRKWEKILGDMIKLP